MHVQPRVLQPYSLSLLISTDQQEDLISFRVFFSHLRRQIFRSRRSINNHRKHSIRRRDTCSFLLLKQAQQSSFNANRENESSPKIKACLLLAEANREKVSRKEEKKSARYITFSLLLHSQSPRASFEEKFFFVLV